MAITNFSFYLNGSPVDPPTEWQDIELIATFSEGAVQASITSDSFTFANVPNELIKEWIADGLTGGVGIFEGIPFQINITDDVNGVIAFDGYLDLSDELVTLNPVKTEVNIRKDSSVDSLADKAEALTYGYLRAKNIITPADYSSIPYVIERENNFIEIMMASVVTFLMLKETAEAIRGLSEQGSNFIAALTPVGVPPVPDVGKIVWASAQLLFQIAYTAVMLIHLINLGADLFRYLISPVKFHKGMSMRKLYEKGAQGSGFQFDTSIQDIQPGGDEIYILPSKVDLGRNNLVNTVISQVVIAQQPGEGFPQPEDFGYTFDEIIRAGNMMFNSKTVVKDGVLEVHSLKTNLFLNQSTYTMPSNLNETVRYNTEDLKADVLIKFATDPNNFWSLDNYKGTSYEIRTEPNTIIRDRFVTLKGFDRIDIPYQLPTRKAGLSPTEKTFLGLFQIIDSLVNLFGGNSQLAQKITARIGMLKMETDYVYVPMILKLNTSLKMSASYRDTWSAKYLWDTYLNERSFVANNFGGQWRDKTANGIGFGLSDFVALTNNAYFYNDENVKSRARKISWKIASDSANFDYSVNEAYTKNLKEITFEP